MKLSQWDRYRNDTVKDRREDELPFIPGQAPAAEGGVAVNLKAPQTPSIKTIFTLTSEGVHAPKGMAGAVLLVDLRAEGLQVGRPPYQSDLQGHRPAFPTPEDV